MTTSEVTTESAATPLNDAKRATRDVVVVMTPFHSYGDSTSAAEVKVYQLVNNFPNTAKHQASATQDIAGQLIRYY